MMDGYCRTLEYDRQREAYLLHAHIDLDNLDGSEAGPPDDIKGPHADHPRYFARPSRSDGVPISRFTVEAAGYDVGYKRTRMPTIEDFQKWDAERPEAERRAQQIIDSIGKPKEPSGEVGADG